MNYSISETTWIPMPDGTRLAARIWIPDGAKTAGVGTVLEALPYRRRDATTIRDNVTYPQFADKFAGVRVDLRGSGDSDGIYDDEYSEQELSDIEATIAWIASQPWSNGKVGMMGISWGGFNGLQVAARAPEALKAVISIASTVDRFEDDIHYKGGAMLSAQLYWATQMLGRIARVPDPDSRASNTGASDWRETWLKRLENTQVPIEPWINHQRRDAFWQHGSICENFSAVEAPCLVIAGWADGYRNTPTKALAGMGELCRALTGPWIHLYPHVAEPAPKADFITEARAWWSQHLCDEGETSLPAHRMYMMEDIHPDQDHRHHQGQWIAVQGSSERSHQLYLSAKGLSIQPGEEAQISLSSPLNCGLQSGGYFSTDPAMGLPTDQNSDDAGSLVFETEVLAEDLDVIGMPTLSLPVAIDAPQGKLIARLVDVHPDGAAWRTTWGVLNLAHRKSKADPQPMTAGKVETVTIELDALAYRFKAGHKLRLAVSTEYFPMLVPSPSKITATIDLGQQSVLNLPQSDFQSTAVTDPSSVEPKSAKRQPKSRHVITRDQINKTTKVQVHHLSHEKIAEHNGMIWDDYSTSEYTIADSDPLSYEAVETATYTHRRGHGEGSLDTKVSAQGRLRTSKTHFHVTARLEASENNRIVYARSWHYDVPRDYQ